MSSNNLTGGALVPIAGCQAGDQEIPFLKFLVWLEKGIEPKSTGCKADVRHRSGFSYRVEVIGTESWNIGRGKSLMLSSAVKLSFASTR